ncbi:Ankyrin repeat protein [Legionella sainthelensi]|uniref:Ankyrin repeat protein n=1 Tax=Legionella sainthelensi TaxID=28087 RepID=A0A0W0YNM9_9GAMM|nr:ankyrin repeat domain-containing protein [Legionella sainthelensi]KTD58134.1 Ankyrin repeat protein [Legionella sainthelensi]VEH30202.1 Ankyrin repeat protein [Legionella sainthelensi]
MLKTRLESITCPEIIPLINEVIDKGSKEDIELLKKAIFSVDLATNHDNYALGGANFLLYVVAMNDVKTLEKMINHGFDYNAGLTEWNGEEAYVSPLMLACFFNDSAIVHILLNNNANFSGYYPKNRSLFETAARHSTREILDLLFNHAKNKGTIKEFLSRTVMKKNGLETIFEPEKVMERLIQIILNPKFNSNLTLKDLRFFSPQIKDYYQSMYKLVPLSTDKARYNQNSSPSFFQPKAAKEQVTKEMAITNALAAYKKILDDPLTCFTLLQQLENAITLKVENTFHTSNLEKLVSTEYTIETHLAMKWPIPKNAYQPLKLDSLLSLSIIGELQKFGCGQSSYKWYGFVNDTTASSHIIDGAHTTEDTLDISALLHGKYSHSIQLLLLMYAIEENLIDVSYGVDQKLEIRDLLRGLVTPATDGKKTWATTNDYIYFDHASFSGPHFLNSILMNEGHKYGLPNLGHALTSSFCKALLRSMEFYNKNHHGEFLSPSHLWDNLISLHNPRIFLPSIERNNHFFRPAKNSIRDEEKLESGKGEYVEAQYIVSKKSLAR